MSKGNYDQVVPATTHDELADLAETINTLARRIREYQQAGTARLVRAQRTAQASIDSLPDPVVVVDPDGNVERFNPAARRVLGLEGTAGLVAWQVPSTVQPHLKEVLSGGADHLPSSLEYAIPLRDEGQEKFYLPRVLAIRSENELLGAALVFTEVTKFRLVDQLKSDMVATVSHELKTPLTSLQMAIHLLLEESVGMLNAKQVDLLLSARQDSDRLLAMVNDLLDLTRIEQGHVRLDLRPVASADLIASAYERFEPIARDARVSLKASVPFGLPPVRVDEERIAHVFDNLINNAISHSTAGGVVQISAERVDNSIRFSITDTGAGIPQQYLPRVFERFFRVPNERNPGGVGLGLAIARDVVEAHQGQIFVESEPGKGTTFSFELPVDLDGGNPTLEVNRVATGA